MEVILKSVKSHPHCPHGPTLMFERYTSDGQKTGRRFFACSACRDRNDCSFFRWVDDNVAAHRRDYWRYQNSKAKPPVTHDEYIQRLEQYKKIAPQERKFCKSCCLLVLESEENCHVGHEMVTNIDTELETPSVLLTPLINSKAEAQYFFNSTTIQFLVDLIQKLKFNRVVSIGAPKIHEHLTSHDLGISSFLLDIDYRYMQFYTKEHFCHYNLFNNCFFGGRPAKEMFKSFLCEDEGEGVILILDPPFGGLVDAVAYTLRKISSWWRKGSKKIDEEVPLMWCFPYFNEPRILETMPCLKMMDYKVGYANQKNFKQRKHGSPVRIFTNVKPSLFVLPEEEGYRFCNLCDRYVWKENQHCTSCKACTTKDGKTYKHCTKCKRCVKSTYEHCEVCKKCVHVQHDCKEASKVVTCCLCNGVGHKRRHCPERSSTNAKKRRT